jgi:hypothetical protein
MIKNKCIVLTIGITIIISFLLARHFSWNGADGNGSSQIIESDGKGYYMYLPAIFIKKNISNQVPDDRFIFKTKNGAINKYYAGTAVCMSPFFGAIYTAYKIFHKPLDGYTIPFQLSVSFAGLFYLLLGLIFLSGLLILYEIPPLVICTSILIIVFGTNLLMYGVYHPSFSHVYSFCFIAMFLYYMKKFSLRGTFKSAAALAFALGMIVIIRPTNGIIILAVPFLAGSTQVLKLSLRKLTRLKYLLPLSIIFFTIVGIQLFVVYLQTGEFIFWSYPNEGFYWTSPQLGNVLISFRKGHFIYTPLALISLLALRIFYKQNKFMFWSLASFFGVAIYLTSAWWCWYYGPSFGQRPFVDFYAVNALLLAFLLTNLTSWKKSITYLTIFLFTVLNLIQSYQYAIGILSSWDMSFEKYKYVFLKTSPQYYSCLGGCNDIKPYCRSEKLLADFKDHFNPLDGEHIEVKDYTSKEFNGDFTLCADSAATKHRLLFAEIELVKEEIIPSGKGGPVMVVCLSNSKKQTYSYYTFRVNEIPNNKPLDWRKLHYTVEIPRFKSVGDELKIYVWNKSLQSFNIGNFRLKLWGLD